MPPRGVVVAGPAFVFVDVRRFHEPVRPASVIVNNTTIINKTTEIAHAKHATRNIDGAGPKRVLVNEGPGLAPIEKATGKKLRQVSIREASSQTRVPPDVSRQSARPRGKEKPAGEAERSPPAQGRQQPRQDSQPSQGKPDGGPAKEKDKDKGKSKGKGGGKGKP
jgi:hypothetical protein